MTRAALFLAVLAGCPGGTVLDTDTTPVTTATATIGADGGTVAIDDAAIDIPAGALSDDVEITLSVDGTRDDAAALTSVFALEPHGQTFASPVTVSIAVGAAEATLLWSEDGTTYAAVDTTVSGGMASTETTTFSYTYASSDVDDDSDSDTDTTASPLPCTACEIGHGSDCIWAYTGDGAPSPNEFTGAIINTCGATAAGTDGVWDVTVETDGRVTFTADNGACLLGREYTSGDPGLLYQGHCDMPDADGSVFWDTWGIVELGGGTFELRTTADRCLFYEDTSDYDEPLILPCSMSIPGLTKAWTIEAPQ